jgi:NitT/TauT family transport system ATP-binding protein
MKVAKLNFKYSSANIPVFVDFDFEDENRFVFFQGLSGSGKTTLLKLLSGNLQAESGKIDFPELATQRCLILQEDALFPWLSGFDNITYILKGVIKSDIISSPMYQHVAHFLEKKAFEMSFGQRRLIELLRAILFRPKYLFLDEPFNYLDEKSRKVVSDILFDERLFSDTRQIFMTTHYTADIVSTPDMKYSLYYFNGDMPYYAIDRQ